MVLGGGGGGGVRDKYLADVFFLMVTIQSAIFSAI